MHPSVGRGAGLNQPISSYSEYAQTTRQQVSKNFKRQKKIKIGILLLFVFTLFVYKIYKKIVS